MSKTCPFCGNNGCGTNKSWKPSSIHILLDRLFVLGKYGRTYSAMLSQEEYASMQYVMHMPNKERGGKSLPGMFAVLLGLDDVNEKVQGELQDILDKRRVAFPE